MGMDMTAIEIDSKILHLILNEVLAAEENGHGPLLEDGNSDYDPGWRKRCPLCLRFAVIRYSPASPGNYLGCSALGAPCQGKYAASSVNVYRHIYLNGTI